MARSKEPVPPSSIASQIAARTAIETMSVQLSGRRRRIKFMQQSTAKHAPRCRSLELRSHPNANRTRTSGNDQRAGAPATGGEPAEIVALVEDVGRENLEVVAWPVETGEQVNQGRC